MVDSQIVALGGGGFSMEPDNPLLEGRHWQSANRLTLQVAYQWYGQAALLATRGAPR